jgi:hypothetical protein
MRVWLIGCVVLAGCGYPALPKIGGGSDGANDAATDGPGDGSSGATGCFQHWLAGSVNINASTVQELTSLSSAGDDRDPWISADGLRLYFARNPGVDGKSDIYFASRPSLAQDFVSAQLMINLDTFDDEGRPSLNGDETLLIFSGDHNVAGGKFQLFRARRDEPLVRDPAERDG